MRRFLFLAVCKAGGALYKKPAGLSIDWLPDTWCFLRRCLRGVIMGPSSRWEIFGRKVQHGWGASALALSGSSERTEWSGDSPLDDSFSARLESEGGGGAGPAGLHHGACQPGQRLGSKADRGTGRKAAAGYGGVNWGFGGWPGGGLGLPPCISGR